MTARHALFALLLCTGFSFNAAAQDLRVLTLNRDHVGRDCVEGPVTGEHDMLAWAVERPWKRNRTVWSGLTPGTYSAEATYRKGIGIELAFRDLPDQPASVLILGERTGNGTGRIAIGPDMVGNCRVKSGKRYPAAAGRLAQRVFGTMRPANGRSIRLRVQVVDR
jgi:hypothetical protein